MTKEVTLKTQKTVFLNRKPLRHMYRNARTRRGTDSLRREILFNLQAESAEEIGRYWKGNDFKISR